MSAAKDKNTEGTKPSAKEKPAKVKGSGGVIGLVILFILIIAAIAALYFAIQFNFGGTRDAIIDTVNKLDPEYVKYTEKLAELAERESAVEAVEKRNETETKRIAKENQELADKRINQTPIYRRNLSETELAEMQSLGQIYTAMEPATAAAIMAELYTVRDMATIIYYMREAAAAAVLAEFAPALAATITEELLITD